MIDNREYMKTVHLQAHQFDAELWEIGLVAAQAGIVGSSKREHARVKYCNMMGVYNDTKHGGYRVKTHEGPVTIQDGDWLATGIDGEHWPISDRVFNRTYAELPKIPKFVADYIEQCKSDDLPLSVAIDPSYTSGEINSWYQHSEWGDADNLIARAWLDGYQIED